jgi:hypothetical protein
MLPSEMLPLNRNETVPGGNLIRQGIEFDAIGRRIAHFLRRHPGDMTDPGLAGGVVRIPAFEIVHVIDPVDAGQLRGVSRFAAEIVKLFLLDQYDDAELDRKKVAGDARAIYHNARAYRTAMPRKGVTRTTRARSICSLASAQCSSGAKDGPSGSGTIGGRSCANSGHCKPLCACVDRTKFVAAGVRGRARFFLRRLCRLRNRAGLKSIRYLLQN